ncbi:FAD-binding oxidoreductase [Saccharopolyspora sp. NFXS83]|uniref:NAD(P)/FAD-dependent oxidoreductase n=1 Tax=Saccharopolyspora sp. NFXS83 TaxID=2993560 RepID=UPI00224B32E1|nr:FAD-binding oxidoreductase [Saccharopolyspora sp. NFXS83]MCX2731731.1 FAD-binding oxidoreductase [Saccharopolyspora sp. NFXS83]
MAAAALGSAIAELRPHVVVTAATLPNAVLARWRTVMGTEATVCVRVVDDADEVNAAGADAAGGVAVRIVTAGADAAFRALAVAERYLLARRTAAPPVEDSWSGLAARIPHRRPGDGADQSVLLIGAGVVNLVTASLLVRHGYRVTVLERSPDPRKNAEWPAYGCSRGGHNARMFTLTEADDYHDKVPVPPDQANTLFDRPPSELGWNILADTGPAERAWIQEFRRVPPWLARAYNTDIFDLNRRSGMLWADWMAADPASFDDVYLRHDILRLYEDADHFAAGIGRQRDAGALLDSYAPDRVRAEFPALAEAAPDAYAGGVLVRGFTLNVHDLIARLLDELEDAGARLSFDEEAETALRDRAGRVAGVLTARGNFHRADHYVVSPGVHGENMLANTESAGQIHGVLGCWLTVPNRRPLLEHSLKVARRGHVAEDANVTVARDEHGAEMLVFGSGYGYTGADPANIDRAELSAIHAAIADTARRLFPRAYAAAEITPGDPDARFCVRPWTASNLGLFETLPATNGAFVVAGGHNTGGFAQAPVVAEAVLNALAGRPHPMHTLYHPRRARDVLGDLPAAAPVPAETLPPRAVPAVEQPHPVT